MTREEARDILIHLNEWRRDKNFPSSIPMPDPTQVGIAIDIAINTLTNVIDCTKKYSALKEKWEAEEREKIQSKESKNDKRENEI